MTTQQNDRDCRRKKTPLRGSIPVRFSSIHLADSSRFHLSYRWNDVKFPKANSGGNLIFPLHVRSSCGVTHCTLYAEVFIGIARAGLCMHNNAILLANDDVILCPRHYIIHRSFNLVRKTLQLEWSTLMVTLVQDCDLLRMLGEIIPGDKCRSYKNAVFPRVVGAYD